MIKNVLWVVPLHELLSWARTMSPEFKYRDALTEPRALAAAVVVAARFPAVVDVFPIVVVKDDALTDIPRAQVPALEKSVYVMLYRPFELIVNVAPFVDESA